MAVLDFDFENPPQVGHQVGVIGVRGTPRLVRMVAEHRPFLMTLQRLDGDVSIQNPGLAEPGASMRSKWRCSQATPACSSSFENPRRTESSAFHLAHAQQRRIDPFATKTVDVGIALVTRE